YDGLKSFAHRFCGQEATRAGRGRWLESHARSKGSELILKQPCLVAPRGWIEDHAGFHCQESLGSRGWWSQRHCPNSTAEKGVAQQKAIQRKPRKRVVSAEEIEDTVSYSSRAALRSGAFHSSHSRCSRGRGRFSAELRRSGSGNDRSAWRS